MELINRGLVEEQSENKLFKLSELRKLLQEKNLIDFLTKIKARHAVVETLSTSQDVSSQKLTLQQASKTKRLIKELVKNDKEDNASLSMQNEKHPKIVLTHVGSS